MTALLSTAVWCFVQVFVPQTRREASLLTLTKTPSTPPSPFESSIRAGLRSQLSQPTDASKAHVPEGGPLQRHNSVESVALQPRRKIPSGLPNTWVAGGPGRSLCFCLALRLAGSQLLQVHAAAVTVKFVIKRI